jgi:hypothetical protein
VIERFFGKLTTKRIRRGVFRSVPELIEAITDFVFEHNANPSPIVWKATADKILDKVGRARAALVKTRTE